jgi:hypothetical protein
MRTASALAQTATGHTAHVEAGSLTTAAGAADLLDRYPVYRKALDWLDQFVTRPHPELGRPGAVCPRLAPALHADMVWLVAIAVDGASTDHAVAAGHLLSQLFEELAAGSRRHSAALLGFFPDLPAQEAAGFIDGGHQRLRPGFVEHGLMLGEFHPTSRVTSVHNRGLAVMRSPVPMFAVRAITPHDLLFLDQPDTPPAARLAYMQHFAAHVGGRLSPTARVDLQARIDGLNTVTRGGFT